MHRLAAIVSVVALWAGIIWAGDLPRPAPPLTVRTPAGEQISLENLRGKVVLLEFFLTGCPHCQRTAPIIASVYKEWRSRGLEVVSVAINPDAKQNIPDFVQRFGAHYPIALGDSNMVRTMGELSAVKKFFVPYMLIIDRRGVIRYEHDGSDQRFYVNENANLRAELDTLLREGAPPRKSTKASRKTS